MKTVIGTYEEANRRAADALSSLLEKKPDAVIAFPGGRTPAGLFDLLAQRCAQGTFSLKDARIFSVADYLGLDGDDPRRAENIIRSRLLDRTDARSENCFFISEENYEKYDEMIAGCGGLDLAILGLGTNAHFGYNEPAVQFDTLSHRQKLTPATRRMNAPLFGSEENTPEYAVTMGIKTVVSARSIAVLAFGAEKAEAVHKMLYGRNDSAVPAAFLQLPMNVNVYLDEAAASML